MGWSKILALCFLFAATISFSQVAPDHYLVYFTDKENTPFSIDNPEAFLSQRAIDRRINQAIPIDQRDLPVDPAYIQDVLNLGELTVIHELKWFNAILVNTTDPQVLDNLDIQEIVSHWEVSTTIVGDYEVDPGKVAYNRGAKSDSDYGPSLNQIEMINGLGLHEDGYTGAGKWIGVFDSGFINAQSAACFETLFEENRIVGSRNFVDGNGEVFTRGVHGTYVLSTMAGVQTDSLIGTAPGASYSLCITENTDSELRIEEANWAAAAEYADSAGVDIINTSLGYSLFDFDYLNYSYADMDGNTTIITRAADVAASRGILMVSSAGNSGNSDWFHITAPADGDSVLAVGAVNPEAESVSFSSRGPSADGRVKPNVSAQGASAIFTNLQDGIVAGNGTSFSAPIVAGMAACLWQAYPTATAWQVHQSIEESAHLFQNPNDSLGYGIPNFQIARDLLEAILTLENQNNPQQLSLFPNPAVGNDLWLRAPAHAGEELEYRITDMGGKLIVQDRVRVGLDGIAPIRLGGIGFTEGLYLLTATTEDGNRETLKFVKQ
ncbi:MAG: S8 family peptidase [Cryomorphaceae bacterium]